MGAVTLQLHLIRIALCGLSENARMKGLEKAERKRCAARHSLRRVFQRAVARKGGTPVVSFGDDEDFEGETTLLVVLTRVARKGCVLQLARSSAVSWFVFPLA